MTINTFGRPVANTSAVREGTDGAAARADHDHGDAVTGASVFKKDTFTLTATTGTWALTYVPVTDSLHVYNGAAVMVEGTDYTLSGQVVSVLAGGVSGDVLVARYAYSSSSPYGSGSGYQSTVVSQTPSAMWLLNETSGTTMVDISGNGRHGVYATLPTKATSLIPSYSGQCNSYAASTRHGDVPYGSWLTNSGGLSLSFWGSTSYTPGAVGTWLERLQDGTSIITTWYVNIIAGNILQLGWYDASGAIRSVNGSVVINDGVARHHAITHDGNQTIKFYVNGALDVTRTQGTGLWTGVNGQGSMRINDSFTHKMQAVSHWGRELTAAEVAAQYTASL